MSLFLLYLCVFLGSFFSFPVLRKCYIDSKKRILPVELDVYSAGFVYFWVLFGVLGVSFIIPNLAPLSSFIVIVALSLFVLYFSCQPMPKKLQNVLEYLLCIIGAYLLKSESSVLMLVLTSFFWLFAWRVFRAFDQFPFISMLMTVIWMMALLIVGQIILLPNFLMVLSGMFCIVIFSVFRKRLKYSCVNLGDPTASLVGYACAGIWAYFFLKGNVATAICAYSYYLFEIVLMSVAVFKGKETCPLFLQSLAKGEKGAKPIKIIFWNILLICLLSVFVISFKQNATSFLLFATLLILCYTHMQLTHISRPVPGYKDIFKDLKQGIKEIYSQGKEKMNKKTVEKTKVNAHKKIQKKSSVKRKTKK